MSRSCDQSWKADAREAGTLVTSDAASFERHTRGCRECRDRVRVDDRIRTLLNQLPAAEPGDLRIHRLRARILSDAGQRTRQPPRWAQARLIEVATFAAVLVAIALLAVRFGSSALREDPLAGTVTAMPGARWSQSRKARVETVLVTEGELWIFVRKQTQGERFLVETPDGELEVRGTTFSVSVEEGSTRHVHVVEGLVILRLRDHPATELAAGQTWDLESSKTPSAPAPDVTYAPIGPSAAPAAAPSASVARNPSAPAVSRAATETGDDQAAMDLYRGGHYGEAAERFRQFAAQHRSSALREDATFLEALTLTKAGHVDAGSVAAWRHLGEFPSSFHKKEASLLLARAARDRGDCLEARRALGPWLSSDADATIREALGACGGP